VKKEFDREGEKEIAKSDSKSSYVLYFEQKTKQNCSLKTTAIVELGDDEQ